MGSKVPANTLRGIVFVSSLADPEVWMRPAVKANGGKFWEYVLCYVDDILAIFNNPKAIMDAISKRYTLKEGSVKPPDQYLGAEVKCHFIESFDNLGRACWSMLFNIYVKRSVDDVESHLNYISEQLSTKPTTPMSSGYRLEIDVIRELDAKRATYFQGLISVLR